MNRISNNNTARNMHSRPLSALVLLTALTGLYGCDVQEDLMDVDPGGGSDPGVEAPDVNNPDLENPDVEAPEVGVYEYVIIRDVSEGYNDAGTPGADICGVSFVCDDDGLSGWAIEAQLTQGAGFLCEGESDECLTSRVDPMAATYRAEAVCDPMSVPSDYVSLGVGGALTLRMMVPSKPGALVERGGLAGCTLIVHELDGVTSEAYTVQACEDAEGTRCAGEEPLVTALQGGMVSVEIGQ